MKLRKPDLESPASRQLQKSNYISDNHHCLCLIQTASPSICLSGSHILLLSALTTAGASLFVLKLFTFSNSAANKYFWDSFSKVSISTTVNKLLIHITKQKMANTIYRRNAGLEAFSHSSTDCSFTALDTLPTVSTKYLNELFLSY